MIYQIFIYYNLYLSNFVLSIYNFCFYFQCLPVEVNKFMEEEIASNDDPMIITEHKTGSKSKLI